MNNNNQMLNACMQSLLQQNPQLQQNQQFGNVIAAISNNDARAGMQLARNYCKSLGISEQDAINQTRQFQQQFMNNFSNRR